MAAFAARYPGSCAEGDRIDIGDQVTYTLNGDLVHVSCDAVDAPSASTENVRTPAVCGRCFLVHRGDCF